MSDAQIYLIGHREVEDHFGPLGIESGLRLPIDYYKIGIATNPRQRLSNLSLGTPHELELVTTIESNNAEVVESQLHSIYSCSKKKGEWFKLTRNDINSFIALNQLEPEDLDPLNDGIIPSWLNSQTSLYVEVERVRRGGSNE